MIASIFVMMSSVPVPRSHAAVAAPNVKAKKSRPPLDASRNHIPLPASRCDLRKIQAPIDSSSGTHAGRNSTEAHSTVPHTATEIESIYRPYQVLLFEKGTNSRERTAERTASRVLKSQPRCGGKIAGHGISRGWVRPQSILPAPSAVREAREA